MRNAGFKFLLCLVKSLAPLACIIAISAPAQDQLRGTLTMALGDLAQIKQKAEAGDAAAQVALADSLASRFRSAEALQWYQKAASQGNLEGKHHVGEMLLFGAVGIPNEMAVKPNHAEGIRWTFMAATNFHPRACWNMSRAFRQGLGVSTNLVSAYAWVKLYSETTSGSIVGRVEMNELALKMDTDSLQQAQTLAARFKSGDWQAPAVQSIPAGDNHLKLSGITFGGKTPLAIINGKTLSEGECARITLQAKTLTLKCLKIEKDTVTVAIQGEATPRQLRLQ